MLDRLRLLVVGASIAGPSTACWLAKAGAHVTVIERFASIRKGGQAVGIRTSGVTVMRRMPSLEALVRSRYVGEEGVGFVDKNGKSYGVIRASGNPDQQTLLSEYEILRGDLAGILYDLTKYYDRIIYRFNEQVSAMRHRADNESPRNRASFGTSAAMTGAYILVGYEKERQCLVKDMQKVSPFLSAILLPSSPRLIWLRDNLFGIVSKSGSADFLQRMFGGAFGKSKEYPVPIYESLK
ncbi:hypothetical protein LTR62_000854 [Meristemomyces frigidus]|uniref:FAD-binding domain-containing protein n=1 Tax=Meristemomyces frigidus TaxID=1508187 RepID=A0AAN7THM6_9PEZI|nr:hypothetical protein LTR62_000854 [Meristemomyces frigidus]